MLTVELPRALSSGDVVAVVSPASWPSGEGFKDCTSAIESWGFRARVGTHGRDQLGYLAGRDEDRLSDLNEAIRDPEVRALSPALRGPTRLSASATTDRVDSMDR